MSNFRRSNAARGGHVTIYRFTTGWKATLGTPTITNEDRDDLNALPTSETLNDALTELLLRGAD